LAEALPSGLEQMLADTSSRSPGVGSTGVARWPLLAAKQAQPFAGR